MTFTNNTQTEAQEEQVLTEGDQPDQDQWAVLRDIINVFFETDDETGLEPEPEQYTHIDDLPTPPDRVALDLLRGLKPRERVVRMVAKMAEDVRQQFGDALLGYLRSPEFGEIQMVPTEDGNHQLVEPPRWTYAKREADKVWQAESHWLAGRFNRNIVSRAIWDGAQIVTEGLKPGQIGKIIERHKAWLEASKMVSPDDDSLAWDLAGFALHHDLTGQVIDVYDHTTINRTVFQYKDARERPADEDTGKRERPRVTTFVSIKRVMDEAKPFVTDIEAEVYTAMGRRSKPKKKDAPDTQDN